MRLLNRDDINDLKSSLSINTKKDNEYIVNYPTFMAAPPTVEQEDPEPMAGLVPSWLYQNYGEVSGSMYGYWTMIASTTHNVRVFAVYYNDELSDGDPTLTDEYGLRPVINLLKSAITN